MHDAECTSFWKERGYAPFFVIKGGIFMKIIANKIKCKKCGEIIESKHRHDFKFCKCGAVAVDDGKDYLRRLGYDKDYEELSKIEKEVKNINF